MKEILESKSKFERETLVIQVKHVFLPADVLHGSNLKPGHDMVSSSSGAPWSTFHAATEGTREKLNGFLLQMTHLSGLR